MNEETIKKAKEAATVEELMALANENGIELSGEQAKAYFDRFHAAGELAEDELANVAGGGCGGGGGKKEVTYDQPGCDKWVHRNCGGASGTIHVRNEGVLAGRPIVKTYTGRGCLKCNDTVVKCHNCEHAVDCTGVCYTCNAP